MKLDQIAPIFRPTTLGAVILCIWLTVRLGKPEALPSDGAQRTLQLYLCVQVRGLGKG